MTRAYEDRPNHPCQYDGVKFSIGREPARELAHHNKVSFDIIRAILSARRFATYDQLADATFGHVSGDRMHPHSTSFVRHCIRNGWIVRESMSHRKEAR